MIQVPRPLSLFLCDQVLFEQSTNKPSLIGCFLGMAVDAFPSTPQKFDVFASLTDGLGETTLDLIVTRLETDEAVYAQTITVAFPDPLRVLNLRYRLRTCSFPAPGMYLFQLLVDGAELAQSRLRVYLNEALA